MGSLVFKVDQKFKTKGIWASKERKKMILNSKDAALKAIETFDLDKRSLQGISAG